jgi:pyruvate dehydrogenase E1 component alpha subunit
LTEILRQDTFEQGAQLPDERLRKIYELMLLTRIFDAQAVNLQRQGRIGFFVPCEGEEAAEIGSVVAMANDDWVFPDYRASGVMIGRGMPLELLFAQLMANAQDSSKGRSMPSHWGSRSLNVVPPSSPICTQLPHAVGAALGSMMKGTPIVALTYFGDGGTSSNDFHSALNVAAVFKTPTVFLCRNNGYAISVPVSRQTAQQNLAAKADAYAMEGVRVDGNDVLAVYRATRRAVEKARRGGGPTLVEAVTYRIGPHSTSDDPSRYREGAEVERVKKTRDPIARFRAFLEARGIWSEAEDETTRRTLLDQVKAAVARAEKIPKPSIGSLFEDVFDQPTPTLSRQAQELESEASER